MLILTLTNHLMLIQFIIHIVCIYIFYNGYNDITKRPVTLSLITTTVVVGSRNIKLPITIVSTLKS